MIAGRTSPRPAAGVASRPSASTALASQAFPADHLDADESVDRAILLEEIEKVVFSEEVLRSEAWDALETVYLMGGGLFGVLSREYAPWEQRGAALLARIEGLPELTACGAGRVDRAA